MPFSAKNSQQNEQSVTYDEALSRISILAGIAVAQDNEHGHGSHEAAVRAGQAKHNTDRDSVTLLEALGCKSSLTLRAPHSTPRTDTSAMDGFAVNSCTTQGASEACPLRLRIVDSIAAGDDHSRTTIDLDTAEPHNICVEIMTGACFPELKLPHLDSVVKIEDVIIEQCCSEDSSFVSRYIRLNRPVKAFQHRRPAGSDFVKGEVIIECGTVLEPKHVAVLASLGYTRVAVLAGSHTERPHKRSTGSGPFLKVGVLSTGSEVVEDLNNVKQSDELGMAFKQAIPDSNGPYLVSSLRSIFPCIEVEHLGIVPDDEEELTLHFKKAIFKNDYDIVITSGGVSKGRHDLVRYVIETKLQGRIVFHGVKIRPGAPVLCAAFDHPDRKSKAGRWQSVFFGAPGNPLATAVALRFFIIPYLVSASSMNLEHIVTHDNKALVSLAERQGQDKSATLQPLYRKPKGMTVFRLIRRQAAAMDQVELIEDQASYKLRVLLEADGWIIASSGLSEIFPGDRLIFSAL